MGFRERIRRFRERAAERRREKRAMKIEEREAKKELERIRRAARQEAMREAVKREAKIQARQEAKEFVRPKPKFSGFFGGAKPGLKTLGDIGERASKAVDAIYGPPRSELKEAKRAGKSAIQPFGIFEQEPAAKLGEVNLFNPFESVLTSKSKRRRKRRNRG